ncbi:MAG TPA: LCP family protein [Candidatus Fimivivens sp.]|nr:LCP family protein [Candidatus Fimivivens sp.]
MRNPFGQNHKTPSLSGQNRHHRIRIAIITIAAVLLVIGGILAWRAGSVMEKISMGKGNIFSNIVKSLPGTQSKLEGEDAGRINILLLGERGAGVDGGSFLTDTIMVLSVHPGDGKEDAPKASLVSIPRDLYVTVPGSSEQRKINAVNALGEEKGVGKGMENMKTIVSQVTGQPIHYAITIDFKGFEQLIDALGGITVHLDQAFTEGVQFHQPQVCDGYVYTVPTKPAQYEHKYKTSSTGVKRLTKSYLLCYNKDEECGGTFQLNAGDNVLDGAKALCYARSRDATSDFDRARRQQEVIKQIKEKALSLGLLSDYSKIDGVMNSLGDNVRTDMEGWELKRLYDLYKSVGNASLAQKVLDTSDGGLLYHPENSDPTAGYILLPIGDSYEKIQALFSSLP